MCVCIYVQQGPTSQKPTGNGVLNIATLFIVCTKTFLELLNVYRYKAGLMSEVIGHVKNTQAKGSGQSVVVSIRLKSIISFQFNQQPNSIYLREAHYTHYE